MFAEENLSASSLHTKSPNFISKDTVRFSTHLLTFAEEMFACVFITYENPNFISKYEPRESSYRAMRYYYESAVFLRSDTLEIGEILQKYQSDLLLS